MAKRQTRRTVSFNRAVHAWIAEQARAEGVSASLFVERALRATYAGVPDSVHVRTVRP